MTASTESRLLLLDGHSLAYRAFFALPAENFSTATGQVTNAVFGFTSMLINMLRDEKPTHIGVAFDVSRQTFRLEKYAEYKANRPATRPEFSGPSRSSRSRAMRPTTSSPPSPAAPPRRACRRRSSPATATPFSWSTTRSPCCISSVA